MSDRSNMQDHHPPTAAQTRRPLDGRVVLVTGVSRPNSIAFGLATRMESLGARVYASGWPPHDDEMPWGGASIEALGFEVDVRDLEDATQPSALIDDVVARFGRLDVVLAVHARSSSYELLDVQADELDRCWAANVRSVVLMAKRFAEIHPPDEPGGRFIWFTSGQSLQPMPSELPYTVTKAALHGMTASLAVSLIERGIIGNCINPGPVDTGYATGEVHAEVASMFPSGRWGAPEDVANLVAFLVSDEGAWVQGQVLNSEGGFRRC